MESFPEASVAVSREWNRLILATDDDPGGHALAAIRSKPSLAKQAGKTWP
jgi:hypothetical protein